MLFHIGSVVLIIMITGYLVALIHRHKEKLSVSLGPIMAMSLTAVAGIALAIVLMQAFSTTFFLKMATAMLFAAIIGFSVGRPFYLKSAINSILLGFLGVIFGTVFGRMLFITNKVTLITVTSFILFSFVLHKMIERIISNPIQNKKTQRKSSKAKSRITYTSTLILFILVIISSTITFLNKNNFSIGQIGQPQTQIAVLDEDNELQEAVINVTASGFSPKDTQFKAGTMIKAVFNVESNSGSLVLVSEDLGIHARLYEGLNNFIMNKPQPGKYELILESTPFKATFTID